MYGAGVRVHSSWTTFVRFVPALVEAAGDWSATRSAGEFGCAITGGAGTLTLIKANGIWGG